ncbi:protein kilB [Streptomyces sp. NBC_01500]|uniref:protein kilB n=1 Tax=Streptomyces sp. NBC_01500 TaxID=2903886 RepID=UPI00224D09EF|nr:protein kilB [Streptomyces sp. NBC_01500]MCX4549451.1 protein kilB [Streptomyces sp. NBC_01500]
MEIAAAVVAVIGTVLGAAVVGVQQFYAARSQRRQSLHDRTLTALSELSTALADHRRAMWVREDLRLSGAAAADVAAAREASHVTRSAVTAPQVALLALLPQVRTDVNAAVHATYDMRGAVSAEVLSFMREQAVAAADDLIGATGRALFRT